MPNIDADGDGIPDTFDTVGRIVMMEGARIWDALATRRKELDQQAASRNADIAQQARTRLRAEAMQSRIALSPVMGDGWWARADLETIGERYMDATAWDGVDPSFRPYVERIEERAKALHDLDPEHIMDAVKARDRLPMDLDQARGIAAANAPQWYRLHDELAGDMMPYHRLDAEERLVADMTHMRDTGRLDTESALREWAKFTDHAPALRHQDENETLDEWKSATTRAAREHWDATVEDRRAVNAPFHPEGVTVSRPMSVDEAHEFAAQFAPDWFTYGHDQNRNALTAEHDVDNIRNRIMADNDMRHAMEHLRDTGTMDHPYAKSMREALSGNPEMETAMGPKPVGAEARIAFGGSPDARPITDGEARQLMADHAPDWYKEPMFAALSPESVLSESQRAGQLDAIRSDMQALRDRGTLSTEHAMRVWAVQQPEFARAETVWGDPVRPNDVWASTAERRAQPVPVPVETRERVGGYVAPRGDGKRSAGHVGPVVDGQRAKRKRSGDDVEDARKHDTRERRAQREEQLRGRGFSKEAIRGQMSADRDSAVGDGKIKVGRTGREEKPKNRHTFGRKRHK